MINILRFIFRKKEYEDDDFGYEYGEVPGKILGRDRINPHDEAQRREFIEGCLEQMKDAERARDELEGEYARVTKRLTDIEELEALPRAKKKEISQLAEKVTTCSSEKEIYEKKKNRMPDEVFQRLARFEEEIPESIDRIAEAEEYQDRIHADLSRLGGEHHAYAYRRHELKSTMANMRGMLIICSLAFSVCIIMLFLLQYLMNMDIRLGYTLAVALTLVVIFVAYIKYSDASGEIRRVEQVISRLILLQNKVKIRYVNNTNLLEYYYSKFGVSDADELSELWEKYREEKEERRYYSRIHARLDDNQKALLAVLRSLRLSDPDVWLKQAYAIGDKKELVEIRHGLILQRQKLRKQMDYNSSIAESASGEVRSFVDEFPSYSEEILGMVSRYQG